jgi:aspartyl protease
MNSREEGTLLEELAMRHISSAFFIVCAIVIVLIPRSARGDAGPTPDEIFKHHASAVGYSAADGSAKPYVMTMKVTWVDYYRHSHESHVVRRQAGAFYRDDETYLGATTSHGFGDGGFWAATANDNVTSEIGLERQFLETYSIIEAEAFDSTIHPESRGTNGADYVVRCHPESGLAADIYFNRDNWLIDRAIIDPDHYGLQIDYSDYKKHGPVTIAMTRKRGVREQAVSQFDTDTVTDFQWDATFPADDFNAPTQKRYVVFPASGRATLPFDFHPGVIVEGSINGATGRFAIDPGEANTLITSGLAAKAGLIAKYSAVQWIGNIYLNPVVTIAFGDLQLRNVHVGVLDGNYLGGYDGTIGYDLLAQSVVDIDFPKRIVSFIDPATFVTPAGRHAVPLVFSGGTAEVIVNANKSTPMLLELDPAAAGQLALWSSIFKDGPLQDKLGISNGVLGELDLGPYVVSHVRVDPQMISQNVWESLTGSMGLLEGGVLQQFDLTLDASRSKAYIDPDSKP